MRVFSQNIEAKLVDFANSMRGRTDDNYAVHFRLSKLSEAYKNDFQIKIAVNILNDLFATENGQILKGDNSDIFLLYNGNDRNLINKAIFQLRYLFFDDSLANLPDGRENPEFCTIYDLNFQVQQFSQLASKVMAESMQKVLGKDISLASKRIDNDQITTKILSDVEIDIENSRLDSCIRKQPICSIKDLKNIKPIFHEIYINIPNLQQKLDVNFSLTGNKWLFLYLTQRLDEKVIETISINPEAYLYMPLSLNLNLNTILSPEFEQFSAIASDFKCQLVLEIGVSDVFSDIRAFQRVQELSQKRNHKICIDGLNNETFTQVSRRKLGFDLAKLQWNADVKGDLDRKEENKLLKDAVFECGANRLILCRCDDIHAIEYGHALGISLFQGRFPDRMLNPAMTVIN